MFGQNLLIFWQYVSELKKCVKTGNRYVIFEHVKITGIQKHIVKNFLRCQSTVSKLL